MYQTSESYKTALESGLIRNRIEGQITLSNGNIIPITEKEIVPMSLSINNKCVGGSDFALGSVYVGELSVTLMKDINRYSLYDAKVEFTYFFIFEDGTEEEIPLGVYYVDDATRTKKLISLTCLDCMTKFDKDIVDNTAGNAFDLLTAFCKECGVPFVQTKEEIEAFPNARIELTVTTENVFTYRECISYIASLLGCYATIDRTGSFVLKQFHTVPERSITARRRTSSTIADYKTYFHGVKARFLAEKNYYPYTQIDTEVEYGSVLDLGDIPIVSHNDTVKNAMLTELLEVVKNIEYVPTDIALVGDPSIDLGDCLSVENANNTDASVITIITSFNWTYRSGHKIKSVGSDSKLKKISSGDDRFSATLEGQLSKKDVIVISYTNSGVVDVSDREMTVITMTFVTVENTRPIFIATVPFNLDVDGNVIVRYYLDEARLEDDSIVEYLHSGKHFLTFTNNFYLEANRTYKLRVTLQTEMIESDFRKHDSKIISLIDYINRTDPESPYVEQAIDKTVPELTIPKFGIKAVLFAQGLAVSVPWNGELNFADEVEAFTIAPWNVAMVDFAEQVVFEHLVRNDFEVSDVVDIEIPETMTMVDLTDIMEVSAVVKWYEVRTFDEEKYDFDRKLVEHNGFFGLNTEHEFESAEEPIDSGRMTVLKIKTDDKATVEGLVIE